MVNSHQNSDNFVKLNLPTISEQPDYLFNLNELRFSGELNCAVELIDKNILLGRSEKKAIISPENEWTYKKLYQTSNQIAHFLKDNFGVKKGNRVLLRSSNTPMAVACWLAIIKVGGIVVSTMPMLRAPELKTIIDKAEINFILCDERLKEEVAKTNFIQTNSICFFDAITKVPLKGDLQTLAQSKPVKFSNVITMHDDPALIAFTSGTTGAPKGTVHFHRDVMAMCICAGEGLLKLTENDLFVGSPPMAFTFGLGMLVAFPLHVGATTILLEKTSAVDLMAAIEKYKATICATAPTAYKKMLKDYDHYDLSSLKKAVSSGEHLPIYIFDEWHKKNGGKLINAFGSTEMTHMFISAIDESIRPGAIGKAIDGYEVCILDLNDLPIGKNEIGRLAVRGPTGCKYLDDVRQKDYVVNGWNITGDLCSMDQDGYVYFTSRCDDMIISSGYNISGPEVEDALYTNQKISECAVIGVPNEERGFVVKAYIVLKDGNIPSEALVIEFQNYIKKIIAPYKYPRKIEFVEALPKTQTGKIQRNKLKELSH